MEEYIDKLSPMYRNVIYMNRRYMTDLMLPDEIKKVFNDDFKIQLAGMPTTRYGRIIKLLEQKVRHSNMIHITYSASLLEHKSTTGGKIKINYAHSIGLNLGIVHPSMISKDGEYRTGLFNLDGPLLFIDKNQELYHKIEGFLREIIIKEKWNISYQLYGYSNNDIKYKEMKTLKGHIEQYNIEMVLFICAWVIYQYRVENGTYITNINEDIHKLYGGTTHKKFYLDLKEKYSKEIYALYSLSYLYYNRNDINEEQVKKPKTYIHKFGIKMIPLTYDDIGGIDNFSSRTWREIAINKVCSDLVLNNICMGLPLVGDWYYIHNIDEFLYDNKNIHIKMKDSNRAKHVLMDIYKAQQHIVSTTDDTVIKKIQQYLKSPIETVKENLSISETAVCFITEDVGRTFMNHFWTRDNKITIGWNDDMFGRQDIFKKYIFEWMYSLYCLNSIVGAFQGDLHLNNITLNYLFEYVHEFYETKSPMTAYDIDGEVFLVPHTPCYASIIDFSRAVIRPGSIVFRNEGKSIYEDTTSKSGGRPYFSVPPQEGNAGIQSILWDNQMEDDIDKVIPEYSEEIITSQIPYMMSLIQRHFPGLFNKYSSKWESVIEVRFTQIWTLLCGTDMYSLSFYMAELFRCEAKKSKIQKRDNVKTDIHWDQLIALLERVYTFLEVSITTGLEKCIHNKIPEDYIFSNPIKDCIFKVFADWKFSEWDMKDRIVMEYFGTMAPQLWSIRNKVNIPDYIHTPKQMSLDGLISPSKLRNKLDPIEVNKHRANLKAEHNQILKVGNTDIGHDMFENMTEFVEKKMFE